ncbi:MAG: protoporphyrinogen oxidase [Desulfurivibrionaceae bacterium]
MENYYDVVVIGAGISGLSLSHYLGKMRPDLKVVLLEKGERPGGAVRSFHKDGFLAEWGPHGFLDNSPSSREILQDTGLDREAQQAPLGDFHRYVCHNGVLTRLPQKPGKILTTPLLSPLEKIRVLKDFWVEPVERDQTVGEWAARRFGQGVLPLVDAALTGSYAGDYEKLSIDAVMPGIRSLELKYGSVLKALLKTMRKKPKKKGMPAMKNFPQGMERLIQVLAQDRDIRLEAEVKSLSRNEGKWEVSTSGGTFYAANLVMALPVNAALKLLYPMSSPPVLEVPVSRIYNVVMGFSDKAQIPYGFGYLAPEVEKRFTLGVMFSSHMFPGRAPGNNQLLEALVGGRRHPERLDLDDETIIKEVYKDISDLMDLPEPPFFTEVLRPQSGIPQLEKDHPALLEWRSRMEATEEGLFICGFGWDGIGINDMTKSARRIAEDLAAGQRGEKGQAEVKPVYF